MTIRIAGGRAQWSRDTCRRRSANAPCTYLIVGRRVTHDVCHYPDLGHILYTEGDTWRITRTDGTVLKSGKVE